MRNNMDFKKFNDLIKQQFTVMSNTGRLFISSVSGEELWDLYINSFKPEDNPVFRDPSSTSHTCNHDKNFIVRYGNVVALDDECNFITMFDLDVEGSIYENSARAMSSAIKKAVITSVFYVHYNDLLELPYEKTNKTQETYQLGHVRTDKMYTPDEANKFGVVVSDKVYTFHHFHVNLPRKFVVFNYSAKELDADKSLKATSGTSIAGFYSNVNTTHELFLKGLLIPLETLQTIKQLMVRGSLLRADLYEYKVDDFILLKQKYEELVSNKVNWTWKKFQDIPFARFSGELIGKTCIDLAEGKNINEVCKSFNTFVDPTNYMKAKAPITQNEIDAAAKRIVELGYEHSFNRRFATINDIDPNMILHSNTGTSKNVKPITMFSKVKPTVTTQLSRHKKAEFDKIDEVSIEIFMRDILPTCKSLQVLFEKSFSNNLVTLTTAVDKESKNPFKWDNPPNLMSWSYNGNLAGKSNLTQQVVARGGRIDGVFRFSNSWNELEPNQSLMDTHVFLPTHDGKCSKSVGDTYGNNERVGWNIFPQRMHTKTEGRQDVDYTSEAPAGYIPVENITFPNIHKLPEGPYKCRIHNWSFRKSGGKGKAELAVGGQLYQYIYPATTHKQWIDVATATLKNGCWTVEHHLPLVDEDDSEIWGLNTGEFHKVNLMCLSPNYWGDNKAGNKHYFFMLDNCYCDEPMRSFHIENLNNELLENRKMLEVFGVSEMLEPTKAQLAGVGFTNDSKETIVVKTEGLFKGAVRIIF